MKTNVTLQSSDRAIFGVTIRQNTKENFLSISDLQKAYEIARWQYGWSDRKIESVTQQNDFKERCFYLLENQGVIKTSILRFMEMVDNEGIVKVLKGLGVWKTTGRGANKSVMVNPYIWTLLAMELNPMIYAKVVVWITDSLIFDRIEAGSEYLPMNTAIKGAIESPDYPKFARTINERVFGHHQSGMRNLASAAELRKITAIEQFITNAINQGWLKSESEILKAIKEYK